LILAKDRAYLSCGFAPMVELLRYLEANGFTTCIASGGDRDFMRPFANTGEPSSPTSEAAGGARYRGLLLVDAHQVA
jgi:hypothetical protein